MEDEASLVGAGWTDHGVSHGKAASQSSSAAVATVEPATIIPQEALAHEALFQIDVLQKVFCWLPHAADLASAAGVSRTWRDALREDHTWRAVYVRQYGTPHPWEACSRCVFVCLSVCVCVCFYMLPTAALGASAFASRRPGVPLPSFPPPSLAALQQHLRRYYASFIRFHPSSALPPPS
ncbi:hypothetical protein Vafri_15868 [Volvox africanus]|uniref:F-box domain-containing protein n=1 Tax=Volvox africanus TaxID=51714 RepID=A0A8J4F534_9CHLO|nr:hypothetical protein Vafri_15868 [Volvox africanus]